MSEYQKYLESAISELRRGTLVLGVLSALDKPMYGYSLIQVLDSKGFSIDQSTLYPLLRRLEKQEFLRSDWEIEESRPRKYYVLSEIGRKFLIDLTTEWKSNIKIINSLLD